MTGALLMKLDLSLQKKMKTHKEGGGSGKSEKSWRRPGTRFLKETTARQKQEREYREAKEKVEKRLTGT